MGYTYDAATGGFVDADTGVPLAPVAAGMPAPSRGPLGEIATGIKRGVVQALPELAGKALKATGKKGDKLYDYGAEMEANANARGALPENQLHPEEHNWLTNALASGGEMLAPSAAGMLAAVPVAMAGAPVAAVTAVGAVATGGLFGASGFQETYEHVKGAGGSDSDAFKAGVISGGIQGAGEGLASMVGAKFATGAGRAVVGSTLDQVLKGMIKPGVVKPFAKAYGTTLATEVSTEMAQNAGTAAVEGAYGVKDADPMGAAMAAIAPTFGLTTLLAPFGLHARYKQAGQIKKDVGAVTAPMPQVSDTVTPQDVQADYEKRVAATNRLGTLLDNSPPPGMEEADWKSQVSEWRLTALESLNAGKAPEVSTLLDGALAAKIGEYQQATYDQAESGRSRFAEQQAAPTMDEWGNPLDPAEPVVPAAPVPVTPGAVVDFNGKSAVVKSMNKEGGVTLSLDTGLTVELPVEQASKLVVATPAVMPAAATSAHPSGVAIGDEIITPHGTGTASIAGATVKVKMEDGTTFGYGKEHYASLKSNNPVVQARLDAVQAAAAKPAKKGKDKDVTNEIPTGTPKATASAAQPTTTGGQDGQGQETTEVLGHRDAIRALAKAMGTNNKSAGAAAKKVLGAVTGLPADQQLPKIQEIAGIMEKAGENEAQVTLLNAYIKQLSGATNEATTPVNQGAESGAAKDQTGTPLPSVRVESDQRDDSTPAEPVRKDAVGGTGQVDQAEPVREKVSRREAARAEAARRKAANAEAKAKGAKILAEKAEKQRLLDEAAKIKETNDALRAMSPEEKTKAFGKMKPEEVTEAAAVWDEQREAEAKKVGKIDLKSYATPAWADLPGDVQAAWATGPQQKSDYHIAANQAHQMAAVEKAKAVNSNVDKVNKEIGNAADYANRLYEIAKVVVKLMKDRSDLAVTSKDKNTAALQLAGAHIRHNAAVDAVKLEYVKARRMLSDESKALAKSTKALGADQEQLEKQAHAEYVKAAAKLTLNDVKAGLFKDIDDIMPQRSAEEYRAMGPARAMDEVTPLQQRIAKAYGNAAEGKAPAGLTAAQRAERAALRKQMLKSMRDAGEVLGIKRSAFTMKDLEDTFDAIDAAARAYTSPNIKTALEDANGRNGLGQVLSIAGLTTTNPVLKKIALMVSGMGVDGINVVYEDRQVKSSSPNADGTFSYKRGNFNSSTNTLTIYQGGENAHVVVHETVHGLTVAALRRAEAIVGKPKTVEEVRLVNALNDLKALYGFLENNPALKGQYAFKNHAEFLAEVMSNSQLQEILRGIAVPQGLIRGQKSWFTSVFDAFAETIKNFLGLTGLPANALEAAIDVTTPFLGPNTTVTAPRLMAQSKAISGRSNTAMRGGELWGDRADKPVKQGRNETLVKWYRQMENQYDEDSTPTEATAAAMELADAKQQSVLRALLKDDMLGFDYPHQAIRAIMEDPNAYDMSPALKAALSRMGNEGYQHDYVSSDSFDMINVSPSSALAASGKAVKGLAAATDRMVGKVDFSKATAKLRQAAWYVSSTKHIERMVENSPILKTMHRPIGEWFKADEAKTRIIEHVTSYLHTHLAAVEAALNKTGDFAKLNARMDFIAREQSLIADQTPVAIDPTKDFAGNKAASPLLDDGLKDRIDGLNSAYMAMSHSHPELTKLIERGFLINRKAYIQNTASLLLSALQAHKMSPSGTSHAAEAVLTRFGKALDIDVTDATAPLSEPGKFLDARTQELDTAIRKAFEFADSKFGGDDMQKSLGVIHSAFKKAVDKPYQFLNRPGKYFAGFNVTDTSPQTIAKINTALDPFGVQIGGFPGGSKHVYLHLESPGEMTKAIEAIKGLGAVVDQKTVNGGMKSDAGKMENAFGASQAISHLRELMVAKYDDLRQRGQTNPQLRIAYDQAVSMINDSLVDMLEADSARTTMTRRTGTPGSDSNYRQTFAKRSEYYVSLISNQYAKPKFDEAFRQMKESIDAQQTTNPMAAVRGQEVADELAIRHANAMHPVDSPVIDAMKAFGYHFYLSMSPAFIMVNLAQPYHLTLPLLGGKFGFVKSGMAMLNGTHLAAKILHSSIKNGWAEGGLMGVVNAELELSKAGLSKGQIAFLQQMIKSGTVDFTQAHEIGRMADGKNRGLANAAKAMGVLTHYSEVMNRLTAGLAAYNLAEAMPTDKRTAYAIDAVNQTQFLYSDHNTARILGRHGFAGKVTPLAASFQNYAFQMMEHYIRLADQGFVRKLGTEEEQKAARKAMYGTLGATSILAGTMGLPFASVLSAALNAASGDDDKEDVRSQYRNWLSSIFGKDVGEVIARGAARAVGFDMSSRAGHADLLPGSRFLADRRAFQDKIKDGSMQMMGPAINASVDVVAGAQHIADGDVAKGFEAMLPAALKGYYKAAQLATKGSFTNAKGNELPIPVDNWDIFEQSLGFTPSKKAEQAEANFYYQSATNLTKQAKAQMVNTAVRAYEGGQLDEFGQAMQAITEYNMRNPTSPITDVTEKLIGRARGRAFAAQSGTGIIDANVNHLPRIAEYGWANTGIR